jgi:hypothetical protein
MPQPGAASPQRNSCRADKTRAVHSISVKLAEKGDYPKKAAHEDDCLESNARLVMWRVAEPLVAEDAFTRLTLASPFLPGYSLHDQAEVILRMLNWPKPAEPSAADQGRVLVRSTPGAHGECAGRGGSAGPGGPPVRRPVAKYTQEHIPGQGFSEISRGRAAARTPPAVWPGKCFVYVSFQRWGVCEMWEMKISTNRGVFCSANLYRYQATRKVQIIACKVPENRALLEFPGAPPPFAGAVRKIGLRQCTHHNGCVGDHIDPSTPAMVAAACGL